MPDQLGRYQITNATIVERKLVVDWQDGHQSRFHAILLRHQCTCDLCGSPLNGVRAIRLHHIPEDIALKTLELEESGVRIVWSDGEHSSHYPAKWLRDHCNSAVERSKRKYRPILWDGQVAKDLPTFDFSKARKEDGYRYELLSSLRDLGFCKITGAPPSIETYQQLIALVGKQRETHYGAYPLGGKKAVDNVGDTTGPLDPHQDETYRLSSIGMTVFLVLHPSQNGGESTLVDGFEAVRRLRQESEEDFLLLSKLPVTTQRFDKGHNTDGQQRWFVSRFPVIRLDDEGELCGLRANERQIAPLDVDESLIESGYRALRRLYKHLYDPALCITLPLASGEGIIFNNQRIAHGRRGFAVENPPRQVMSAPVDLEEFYSNLRLLEAKLGLSGPLPRYHQGTGA